MNDSVVMRLAQRLQNLPGDAQRFALVQRAVVQFSRKRLPGDQLHHQEVHAILGIEFVDRGDVRMIQAGKRQRFVAKALARNFIGEAVGG